MTQYPVQTVTLQIGRYQVTAIEPATPEGKAVLVEQAMPQIMRLLEKDKQREREAAK